MQAISQHTQNLQHSTYSTGTSPQFQNACGMISSTSEEGRTDDGKKFFHDTPFQVWGNIEEETKNN
jgi:hypothetical protein